MAKNRRRTRGGRRTHRRNRRRLRRNYRRNKGFFSKLFRKNPGDFFMTGVIGFAGFAATKFFGNLIAKGLTALSASSAPPAATLAPVTTAPVVATPATSGLGSLDTVAAPLGAIVAGAVGIGLTMKMVQDPEKKEALLVGQVVSILHTLAVAGLKLVNADAASVLSGDDTAVKLAAMYGYRGFGGGTSIMPRYAPINGMGEYLVAQSGMGALPPYAAQAGGPMGEYFESGVEGLGNYIGNADIQQAAAGYGAGETANTNHIDPSSDLDRELNIAEAAAGVGANYQAAAGMRGMGEYYDSGVSGLGNIGIAPSASTWIPGTSDGQLWAGTRAIDKGQEATAMVPAGVLTSGGGQGVLG